MKHHDDVVAAYQAELLRILHSGSDGEAMSIAIAQAQEGLGAAQQPLDETLVEVAADLTKTWGRLRPS